MPERPAACVHMTNGAPGPLPWRRVEVLDFHNGLTDGIVACTQCDAFYLLAMLDWGGEHFAKRIYSVAQIGEAVAERYRYNAARPTCQVGRAEAELHALHAASRLTHLLVAVDVRAAQLRATASVPDGTRIPTATWRTALPAAADETWFERLGIRKTRG